MKIHLAQIHCGDLRFRAFGAGQGVFSFDIKKQKTIIGYTSDGQPLDIEAYKREIVLPNL